jgi:hypothetical protein
LAVLRRLEPMRARAFPTRGCSAAARVSNRRNGLSAP